MNTKEKELFDAIKGTERMSGIDSYDSAEGDMSFFDGDEDSFGFDGDDMSYMDGDDMSFASGGKSQAVSDPYIVQYENTTSGTLTATIFGFNDYLGTTNFNNPVGITVTNVQGGTYASLVTQSNNKPFKINTWRFISSNANQLAVSLLMTSRDANGRLQTIPLNLSTARDPYQQQSDILEVVRPLIVDANSYVTFPLLGGAILTITMFPTQVVSSRSRLKGGSGLGSARVPKTSGRNVSPVIINTSQGVGGIRKR